MPFLLSLALISMFLSLFRGPVLAQDPVKAAPQAYKLDFENDWVKVLRAHYAAKEKVPEHDHPATAAAFVYLNDSGPVIFKHIGLSYGPVTRPATKAGGFRVWYAVKETHEVENNSDTPSDFVRIEFKTDPVNARSLRGKFPPLEYSPDEAANNLEKVQFENEQIKVTRVVIGPQKTLRFSSGATEPALIVAITPATLNLKKGANLSSNLSQEKGKTLWIDQGSLIELNNTGGAPAEFLRFDLKTGPVSAGQIKQPGQDK